MLTQDGARFPVWRGEEPGASVPPLGVVVVVVVVYDCWCFVYNS